MKRTSPAFSKRGFSLIEVTMTIGVVAFALVGLMGMLPLALEQTRNCVNETRAAHLTRMIFTTLQSETYTSATFFGSTTEPLNLSQLTTGSPAIVLFATYNLRTTSNPSGAGETPPSNDTSEVHIYRTNTAPAGAQYRIEIKSQPVLGGMSGAVRGQNLRMTISQMGARKPFFQTVQFVSRLNRGVQPQ